MNGVSTLDLVLIQKHILGSRSIETPYKMIAADIDNNNDITVLETYSRITANADFGYLW